MNERMKGCMNMVLHDWHDWIVRIVVTDIFAILFVVDQCAAVRLGFWHIFSLHNIYVCMCARGLHPLAHIHT